MKKFILSLMLCLVSFCFIGCEHKHDHIEIYNKSDWTFDNISIEIKDGYFYDNHEKFKVDEDTVGVTIYFSTDAEDELD